MGKILPLKIKNFDLESLNQKSFEPKDEKNLNIKLLKANEPY